MTVISEYDAFIIYEDLGKLFALGEGEPTAREVKEVYRIPYEKAKDIPDVEILDRCPMEYDLSGEPILESDYVFWEYVTESKPPKVSQSNDSLKVTPELDEKYKTACSLCKEKHKAIYGDFPNDCAFRSFDNEYCSDIITAERLNKG